MLPATSPVRQYNDQVEKEFVLHAVLAGDPIARDTFGAEMFRQMGLFSPIAGLGLVPAAAIFGGSALATVMARRLEGGAAGMIPSSAPR